MNAIHTHFVYPPIPTRNFDWMACQGDYEPGCTVGYGATQQAAIDDLREQIGEEQEQFEELVDKSQHGSVTSEQQ